MARPVLHELAESVWFSGRRMEDLGKSSGTGGGLELDAEYALEVARREGGELLQVASGPLG